MRLGTCATYTHAVNARAAGFDFIEVNTQQVLRGEVAEDDWDGERQLASSVLAVPVANGLIPRGMTLVGPAVDDAAVSKYVQTVFRRAESVGIRTVVVGAGAARMVPAGFPATEAFDQLIGFLLRSAPIAAAHGITLALEPLNRGECNLINTIGEAVKLAELIDHKAVRCLLDTYHFWVEGESLGAFEAALPWIAHVHLADHDGRLLPGNSGTSDYLPLFRLLKTSGYDGGFSFEGRPAGDFGLDTVRAVRYTRDAWERA